MATANLFHPRHYPVTLGFFAVSALSLIAFHLLFWLPLQDRVRSEEETWQSKRPRIGELERYERAQRGMREFWEVLPRRKNFPDVVSALSDLAREHHLTIPAITYQSEKVDDPSLTRIGVSFAVRGAYPDIRSFIASIERSEQFFIIEDMNLVKAGTSNEDPIQLQIRMGVYLINAAGGPAGGAAPGAERRRGKER